MSSVKLQQAPALPRLLAGLLRVQLIAWASGMQAVHPAGELHLEAKRGGAYAADPATTCAHGMCSVEFMPYRDMDNEEGAEVPVVGGDLHSEVSKSLPPTPWMTTLQKISCTKSRGDDLNTNNFIYCAKHRTMIYSPSLKLAYIKTGKAASTAFFTYFRNAFVDAEVVDTADPDWLDQMPQTVFFFTFVREPVSKQLASYAEVDAIHYPNEKDSSTFANSTFHSVSRNKNGGTTRYLRFLHDLVEGRFGYKPDDVAEDSSVRHASSQLASTCTHGLHFIGHLENIEVDWATIQELAGVPLENRSVAIPKVHDGEAETHRLYAQDEGVKPSDLVLLRMCRVYRADFDCLGYPMPEVCMKKRKEGAEMDQEIETAFNARFTGELLPGSARRAREPTRADERAAVAVTPMEPVEDEDVDSVKITLH